MVLANGDKLLQTVFNFACRGAVATLDSTISSVLELHMSFHSLGMLEEAIQAKDSRCFRSYLTEMLTGNNVQKISKVRMALAEAV